MSRVEQSRNTADGVRLCAMQAIVYYHFSNCAVNFNRLITNDDVFRLCAPFESFLVVTVEREDIEKR